MAMYSKPSKGGAKRAKPAKKAGGGRAPGSRPAPGAMSAYSKHMSMTGGSGAARRRAKGKK